MKVTAQFFDRRKVEQALDRAARKALSKAGAFVRRRARSSIRRSKKISQPGQPPRAHSRDKTVSIKNILFAYEPARQTVIVGPVGLSSRSGDVPAVLEKGGRTTIVSGPRRARRKRTVTVKARPFMGPALEKERPQLAELWRNSVKR